MHDSVFLDNRLVDKNSVAEKGRKVYIYMLIEPTTETNSSKKPYLVECDKVIATDSLVKYKTAYIGIFIDWEIKDMYQEGENYYFPMIFQKIAFDKRILVKDNTYDYGKVPPGYIISKESGLYMIYGFSKNESPSFR